MPSIANAPDPRIGYLIRNGVQVFYAFPNGYSLAPIEGSLHEVEVALGIAPTQQVTEQDHLESGVPRRSRKEAMRSYNVTIKPSVTLYSDSQTFGETIERIDARNRREAEKTVRQRLRDVNGRHGPKYNVTARLATDS